VDLEPTFDVPIVNVTVVRGQIALLPCSIDFLGKHKVIRLVSALQSYTAHCPGVIIIVDVINLEMKIKKR